MTDQLPAPKVTIEMSLCRCEKSDCNSRRCVCRKNGLVCTEMCGCIGCKNDRKEYIIV